MGPIQVQHPSALSLLDLQRRARSARVPVVQDRGAVANPTVEGCLYFFHNGDGAGTAETTPVLQEFCRLNTTGAEVRAIALYYYDCDTRSAPRITGLQNSVSTRRWLPARLGDFVNSRNESTLGRLLECRRVAMAEKIGIINLKARLYAATIERGLPKPAEPSMRGPRCLALREGCRRDELTNWDQSPA
jgi:hypothetical protein